MDKQIVDVIDQSNKYMRQVEKELENMGAA
jgi:hypothetical protein